ncbi:ATPase [Clavibacter sp. VKM Ac-2872]|uniref:MinD/ParA family ATP-binding protein n=1 Tax=Clavibacter sp. VKM Ac-2872 TaxID=2783812 RepID=UPI00188A1949|nr:ATPase [Clavibacter sp. VKM Ac-2872]MBF4624936.1 ATPase [Clavibacter sp. VKM Ac-2872]
MTDDTHDTGHRDGGAAEPPLLSRRELRRRQQEMERSSTEPSGDAHRWVDPFPAVPRTSDGGLFGPDRVRPGAAPVEAPTSGDEAEPAPQAESDAHDDDASGAEPDEEIVVGTHAFDELFDDADDDVDPEDRVPDTTAPAQDADADDARPAAAPSPFDAVVSPEAGSAWTVPAPHVVNAHPFRMPLRPSSEASETAGGESAAPAWSGSPAAPADSSPVDDAPPARTAAAPVEPQPTPVASLPAAPDDLEEPADDRRPGTDLTAFPDADPQRYVMRTPRADAATSALTLFPEQTGQRPPRGPAIARTGFRGFMNTVTGGVFKIGPGAEEAAANAEVARREGDERVIRQATWSRAVSVLVANRKGGVGKTPTSLILGGVLGSIRGGSVAVVEVTDDPGALGYRAEGQPTRGLGELVRDRDEIHSAGQLAGYTAPQTSFASVVASVGPRRELTGDDVIGVARLIDEYYAVRVMDSGNQPSSSAFRGAIEVTDVLVVPVLNAGDAVLEAVALLDFLRELGGHAAMLADNAVIIRLHDGRPEDPAVVARIDRILGDARPAQIFTVPYDAHIAERGPISLASLDPVVARAFTAATAGVVQRLAHAVR